MGSGEATNVGSEVALLAQKLDWLGGLMQELKVCVGALEDRVQGLREQSIGSQAKTQEQIDRAERHQQRQDDALKDLQKWRESTETKLQKLLMAYGIIIFLGSALGVSVVALIWALITGQATVVFK